MTITIGQPPLVQGRLKRLVTLWRIVRTDGTTFRFTNHSNIIMFAEDEDGVERPFIPSGGLDAGARRRETALKEGNTGTRGVINSDSVSAEDLALGLFDEASFTEYTVDWRFPYLALQTVEYSAKTFSFDGSIWRGELVGITHRLHEDIGRYFARTCDADLGDARCGFDLDGLSFFDVRVLAVSTTLDNVFITSSITGSLGVDYFMDGEIEWTVGNNLGARSEIQANLDSTSGRYSLTLYLPPAFPIEVDDEFTLRPGCDKSATTCRVKFANLVNFRGFNFMPGTDRYVGASPNT